MTISFYPETSYWLVATGSTLYLGSCYNATWGDLALIQLRLYNKSTPAYSYQMRVVVSATQLGTALASSAYSTFDNAATGQVGADWLGDATFELTPYAFKDAETYHFRLELTGYTRPAYPLEDTLYLAASCDWMQPIGNSNTAAARMPMGAKR